MSARIGLYGGSFDPVHFGHLISARSVAEQLSLDRITLIPSARPPHKLAAPVTDPRHRLAMLRLAVEGDPLFDVSDVELERAGPSYTLDTVNEFRRRLGEGVELFWLIGADSLPELAKWHRAPELVQRVQIVSATRPGAMLPSLDSLASWAGRNHAQKLLDYCLVTPQIEISSTEIRARSRRGLSIQYMTPTTVTSYIQQNQLYATGARDNS